MTDRNVNKYKHNIIIILSFCIFSILSVLFIWYKNRIYFTGDAPFHIQRISELIKSQYIFPNYSLNSFDSAGSAVMTAYPYLFLYPTVFLFHLFNSIKISLYITFVIGTFITLLVSFYSSLTFSKNYRLSYLFSLVYSLSYEFIAMYFSGNDMGVYWSSVFLPLVIFGFIYYILYSKWLMLSIGMTLMMYSSLITVAFLVVLLMFWLLINYKNFNKNKFYVLSKSVSLSLLASSVIWLPLIKIMLFNKLYTPSGKSIRSVSLFYLIRYAVLPRPRMPIQLLTIYSILGIIFGALLFKRFSKFVKQLYLISIVITLFCSDLFPWGIFSSNNIAFRIFRKIQFSFRMLVVPQILLEFIFSLCIIYFFKKYNLKKILRICFLLIIIFIQLFGQGIALTTKGNSKLINNGSIFKDYSEGLDYKDYFPQVSTNNMNIFYRHYGYINNNDKIYVYPHGNGNFRFHVNKDVSRLTIPFVCYKGIPYNCYLNNKLINVTSNKRQLLILHGVHRGNNSIQIKFPMTTIQILSKLFTISGILLYLFYIHKYNNLTNIR